VRVLTHDAPEYIEYLVVPKVAALQAAYASASPAAVLIPSSAEGKEIGPPGAAHRRGHHH
jgi:electron transfer flavoprotein alpha subunit